MIAWLVLGATGYALAVWLVVSFCLGAARAGRPWWCWVETERHRTGGAVSPEEHAAYIRSLEHERFLALMACAGEALVLRSGEQQQPARRQNQMEVAPCQRQTQTHESK